MAGADQATWISFAGAIFGGAGLKLMEYWLGRSKADEKQEILEFQRELRSELESLRDELHEAQVELHQAQEYLQEALAETDEWRDKYYDLREKVISLQKEKNGE